MLKQYRQGCRVRTDQQKSQPPAAIHQKIFGHPCLHVKKKSTIVFGNSKLRRFSEEAEAKAIYVTSSRSLPLPSKQSTDRQAAEKTKALLNGSKSKRIIDSKKRIEETDKEQGNPYGRIQTGMDIIIALPMTRSHLLFIVIIDFIQDPHRTIPLEKLI